MQKELEERYQKYQKQKGMMKDEEKQKEEESLNSLNSQILKYREDKFGQTNGEIIKLRNDYLEPIRSKIRTAIDAIAKEEKMNFVFDKGSPYLLYAEEKYDITYRVLDNLKRGGAK